MRTTTKSNWSLLLTGSIYNFYSRSSSSLSLPQARWPPSASLLSDGCGWPFTAGLSPTQEAAPEPLVTFGVL